MPGAGQPVAVSFGCVESTPTVAFLHGTYEPAAVPVNHRLALRERRRAKAARAAKLANAVSFSPGGLTVAQELTAEAGSSGVP